MVLNFLWESKCFTCNVSNHDDTNFKIKNYRRTCLEMRKKKAWDITLSTCEMVPITVASGWVWLQEMALVLNVSLCSTSKPHLSLSNSNFKPTTLFHLPLLVRILYLLPIFLLFNFNTVILSASFHRDSTQSKLANHLRNSHFQWVSPCLVPPSLLSSLLLSSLLILHLHSR